jgi:hypothetical protein
VESERRERKLAVNRETVRELTDNQLGAVGGGPQISVGGCWTPVIWTLPVQACLPPVAITGTIC